MEKLKKISDYLFYLFAFLLPWQMGLILREPFLNGDKWQYGTIIFYLADLVLILIFGIFIFQKFKDSSYRFPKISNISKVLIFFLCWSFLSIFWSPDRELAFYSFIKLSLAIALVVVILNSKLDWKKIFFIFIVSALLQSSLGLWQFFSQETFANKYLGLSRYNPKELGISVVETPERRWLRAYGGFSHPNILGGYLAINLLFLVFLYLKRTLSQNFSSLSFNIFYLTSFAFLLAGLIVSFSRAAWLAFILGFIFLILFVIFKKNKFYILKLVKLSFIFFLVSLILITALPDVFSSRINLKGRLETKSIEERTDYNKEALFLIKNNLWLGVGIGNYTLANYQALNKPYPAWYFQPVHNTYLLILAELGIFGFLLFLFIVFYPFYFFIKNKYFDLQNTVLALMMFSLLLIMLFDHYLWSSHFGILFFFLTLGLFVKNIFQTDSPNLQKPLQS